MKDLAILGNVRLKRLGSWVALAVVISWCRENFRFLLKVNPRSLIPSFVSMKRKPSRLLITVCERGFSAKSYLDALRVI